MKELLKVECTRCTDGKGNIRAFSHVKGGVCFKCDGKGYILQKSKPRPSLTFKVYQKWTDPQDCNYNGGDFLNVFSIKARSQAEADRKLNKMLGHTGREFYAELKK